MELSGKSAVITGAASGLGRQLALDLAALGCRLMLADRDEEGLAETRRQVETTGGLAAIHPCDITREEECAGLIRSSVDAHGSLDILVLCAGVSMWARFDEVTDLSPFRRLLEVNYLGAVYCVHAALPWLLAGCGQIVAISSLQGEIALPAHSGYAAAKHALNGFLDGLDFELGGEIRILKVLPGWIRGTNLRANAFTASSEARVAPRKHSRQSVSVEECSRLIIGAMKAGRRELFVPRRLVALRWLKLFAPGLVRRLIGRAVRDQK